MGTHFAKKKKQNKQTNKQKKTKKKEKKAQNRTKNNNNNKQTKHFSIGLSLDTSVEALLSVNRVVLGFMYSGILG